MEPKAGASAAGGPNPAAGATESAVAGEVTFVPADYEHPGSEERMTEVRAVSGGGGMGEVAEPIVSFHEGGGFVSVSCEGTATGEGRFAAAAFHAALVLIQQGDSSAPSQGTHAISS